VDLFARFRRQSRKAQASLLSFIHPRQLADGLDSPVMVREPERDRPIALNRIERVKAKSATRDIQNDAAVIRLDIDVGVSLDFRPRSLAAFRNFHWQHHSVVKLPGFLATRAAIASVQ
jgi:hypothetical protein